jgi:hypothetical protein
MTNTTKILLSNQELRALTLTDWSSYIDKAVENDQDWGLIGSNHFLVVYFNVEFTPTQLVSIGMDIQKKINYLQS